jgi:hypothetical protein
MADGAMPNGSCICSGHSMEKNENYFVNLVINPQTGLSSLNPAEKDALETLLARFWKAPIKAVKFRHP